MLVWHLQQIPSTIFSSSITSVGERRPQPSVAPLENGKLREKSRKTTNASFLFLLVRVNSKSALTFQNVSLAANEIVHFKAYVDVVHATVANFLIHVTEVPL